LVDLRGPRAFPTRRSSDLQRVVDQGAFARTGHAGDTGEQPHGHLDVHTLEVVAGGVEDAQARCLVGEGAPFARHLDAQGARQITDRKSTRLNSSHVKISYA